MKANFTNKKRRENKMKPNIGIVNAIIRMTFGFTILAWATAKMTKRPWRESYLWIAMLAAMKIAEGIVRFCPMTALFERYQEQNEKKEEHLPINPS
jgi:nucleoside recognition membrane protein YjiH